MKNTIWAGCALGALIVWGAAQATEPLLQRLPASDESPLEFSEGNSAMPARQTPTQLRARFAKMAKKGPLLPALETGQDEEEGHRPPIMRRHTPTRQELLDLQRQTPKGLELLEKAKALGAPIGIAQPAPSIWQYLARLNPLAVTPALAQRYKATQVQPRKIRKIEVDIVVNSDNDWYYEGLANTFGSVGSHMRRWSSSRDANDPDPYITISHPRDFPSPTFTFSVAVPVDGWYVLNWNGDHWGLSESGFTMNLYHQDVLLHEWGVVTAGDHPITVQLAAGSHHFQFRPFDEMTSNLAGRDFFLHELSLLSL